MSSENRSARVFRPFLVLLVPLSLFLTGCSESNLFDLMMRPRWGFFGTVYVVLALVAIVDLLGEEDRGTMSAVLWILLIVFFPLGGVILYFIFGRD